MRVLFIGDVVGSPGRRILASLLPELKDALRPHLTVANGENTAGGIGATPPTVDEIAGSGVDVVTMGNHVWKKREMVQSIDQLTNVIRPANLPPGNPGTGSTVFETERGPVGVINLQGRVFMQCIDCPFAAAEREIDEMSARTKMIVVDFHAEATSEKIAMARFLDGKVSAVIGTHTHVQTADEQIFPGGTAYITDTGMAGPQQSILGLQVEKIIDRFRRQIPIRFDVAKSAASICGVYFDIDEDTGKAGSIVRLNNITEAGQLGVDIPPP
jgi:metallophosphoesterase (TIGR00282 family)